MVNYNLNIGNVKYNGDNEFVKFRTTCKKFNIHFQVSKKETGYFPHMGVTAREGLAVMYRKFGGDSYWVPINLFARENEFVVDLSQIINGSELYEICIYGPVLAHLDKLSIIIDDESKLEVLSEKTRENILVLGCAKTFGIGVTSAAIMFSNIMRREFQCRLDRIAYNKKNYLGLLYKDIIARNVSGYDFVILEVDAVHQDIEIVDEYLKSLIEKLKKENKKIILWHVLPETVKSSKTDVVKNICKANENSNCRYLSMDYLHDEQHEDIYSYSKNFINDAGQVEIYRKLREEMRRI